MKILVSTDPCRVAEYTETISRLGADLGVKVSNQFTPEETDIIIYEPSGTVQDFSPFTNLKLIQSIWAGVDKIVGNETLTQPLCRMSDAGLAEGMREYVCGHILADHINLFEYASRTKWDDSEWLPLARNVTVGIIGMGTLGRSVAVGLEALGFHVTGWTRSGADGTLSGEAGLSELLAKSDYIVTLLPHTPETEDVINAKTLAQMKPNAMIINPGRGALIHEDDLIAALDSGQIRKAVLDVFKQEPLPETHAFWAHPQIIITPHIAAKSRVETTCEVIIENLTRLKNGEPLKFLVDRKAGY